MYLTSCERFSRLSPTYVPTTTENGHFFGEFLVIYFTKQDSGSFKFNFPEISTTEE
jgi:hypothetical protein